MVLLTCCLALLMLQFLVSLSMMRLDFGQELDETDQLATLNILATSGRPGQTRR
jgi:hypothetical protein